MRKKAKGISVSFKGVESGGRSIPDGTYVFEVEEITLEKSEEGNDYLKWVFKGIEGKAKGSKLWDNTSLQPQALWRLKGLLEALGVEVPDDEMDLELDEYVGMTTAIDVANEKYQGKDKPRAVGFHAAEDAEGEEDGEPEEAVEEEEPEPEEEKKPAKSVKKKPAAKKAEPEFKVGMKVTFDDDGDEKSGKITAIDEDEVATVKVGKEEWEIAFSDLTVA